MISGRTDLKIGVSGAKFDGRADFEVRLRPAPSKHPKNIENLAIFFVPIFSFFVTDG